MRSENILGQIRELVLHVLQHGDERAFLRVMLLDDLFNGFQLHVRLPPLKLNRLSCSLSFSTLFLTAAIPWGEWSGMSPSWAMISLVLNEMLESSL